MKQNGFSLYVKYSSVVWLRNKELGKVVVDKCIYSHQNQPVGVDFLKLWNLGREITASHTEVGWYLPKRT